MESFDSASASTSRRSLEHSFSASSKYFDVATLRGRRKNVAVAMKIVKAPSIKKRYCHPYNRVSINTDVDRKIIYMK